MGTRSQLRIFLAAMVLAAAPTGCRHAAIRPPALFPMETVAVVKLEDLIDGPLASDGIRFFVTTRSGELKAFDAGGVSLWSAEQRPGRVAAAKGALVLRDADGAVWSLEPETGSVRWTTSTRVTGSLAPVIASDRVLIAGQGIAALDLATGRPFWSLPGPPVVSAPPVSDGPRLFVGEADGTLRCRDGATGYSIWTYKTGFTLVAPPVVDPNRRVLLGTTDRRILSLTVDEGRSSWKWKVGADLDSPGVLHDGRVLFAAFDDVLYCLNRGNGNLVWRTPLPSRPLSGPILVGEAVLLSCYEKDILGFDARTGRKLGGMTTPAEIRSPPLLLKDRLYVALRDRSVMIYQLNMTPATLAPPSPRPSARRDTAPRPRRD